MTTLLEAIGAAVDALLLSAPIYTEMKEIDDQHGNRLMVRKLRTGSVQIDCYCVYCQKPSTFKTIRINEYEQRLEISERFHVLEDGIFPVSLYCQRDLQHIYTFMIRSYQKTLAKIGQFPSLEDLASSDIQKFRPVMEKTYFSELHRAGGLASHGIGIGSFVYLRRIFERLIVRHHDDLVSAGRPVEGFNEMRMAERIDALADVLPVALVENKAAYSILSKGLHELDEDTCKRYFPLLRAAIIAILEEDLQASEKRKAAEQLRKAIAEANGEIKRAKA